MKIKKISTPDKLRAEDVPQLMLAHQVEYWPVKTVNWPEAYPCAPKMEVALAHTGDRLLIHYRVEEKCIRAAAECDGGHVWEDSCCEIFLQPSPPQNPSPFGEGQGERLYYNLECNCAGTLLIGKGESRHSRQPATAETMEAVDRWSSLMAQATRQPNGRHTLPLTEGDFRWHLALVVPVASLFGSGITDFSGQKMRANIYKCGDGLSEPHFLSLFPIDTPQPDFHRPEFFQELEF